MKTVTYHSLILLILLSASASLKAIPMPYEGNADKVETRYFTLNESVIKDRLAELDEQSAVPLKYHSSVKKSIIKLSNPGAKFLPLVAHRSQRYFPMLETIFAEKNFPQEMKYLAAIESALDTRAVSSAGAAGMWQFMKKTAEAMGLKVNTQIDERNEPGKATHAAIKYLNFLNKYFDGDWLLALAAYNCGMGNVRKAIRKSGYKSYWKIRPFLPRETQHYVPNFIAATYIMNHLDEFNYVMPKIQEPTFAYNLLVKDYNDLNAIAANASVSMDDIYQLNPELVGHRIPNNFLPYTLKMPAKEKRDKESKGLPTVSYLKKESASGAKLPQAKVSVKTAGKVFNQPVRKLKVVEHRVESGQTLSHLALIYSTSVGELKAFNNLDSDRIRIGQRIKVKRWIAAAGTPTTAITTPTSTQKIDISAYRYIYYTVQQGDSQATIFKKYPLNTNQVMQHMNPEAFSRLEPGTRIKLIIA